MGSTFPLVAPLAAVFTAWASPEEQQRWVAEGTRLAGSDLTDLATATMEAVRSRGYEVATGREVSEDFRRTVIGEDHGQTGEESAEFAQVVRDVVAGATRH